MYSVFCQRIQNATAYYYSIRQIVTVILLYVRVLLTKCTPHQHLDCNISHYQNLPHTFRSTKQFRLSILPMDKNTLAVARLELTTLVISVYESCTFRYTTRALKYMLRLLKRLNFNFVCVYFTDAVSIST